MVSWNAENYTIILGPCYYRQKSNRAINMKVHLFHIKWVLCNSVESCLIGDHGEHPSLRTKNVENVVDDGPGQMS